MPKRTLNQLSSWPNKKAKTLDDLPWKSLQWNVEADDGILQLEEVEGVEVTYGQDGRLASFNLTSDSATVVKDTENIAEAVEEESELEDDFHLLEWANIPLATSLLRTISLLNFNTPTPIQSQAIPPALLGRDIIGVAQTGSGKTLAYGLPILNHIIQSKKKNSKIKKRKLSALVLAPTRELALQIVDHLKSCVPQPKKGNIPLVSIAAIVGGLSVQKQNRVISRGVDILIATPGRLWDTIQSGTHDLKREIEEGCKFLVLDEADRMIQAGHFEELDRILGLMRRWERNEDVDEGQVIKENLTFGDGDAGPETAGIISELQTFVFSATLSKDLQANLSKRRHFHHQMKKKASTLDDLLLRLDFRDPEPVLIDLTSQGGLVDTLSESKIECLPDEKDLYLYYFFLRYPGKSIVFLPSIDGIRRLLPLLTTLDVNAYPLHSQLEQRQRLKNLDRFKSFSNSVLLATDIASRGLDIPSVSHVIHYSPPLSADAYVHRVGRTARAGQKGFSLGLIAPAERGRWIGIMKAVGRDGDAVGTLEVPLATLDKLKQRVNLAKEVERAIHRVQKKNHDEGWMREAAETLGVDIDDVREDDNAARVRKNSQLKLASLKSQLKSLLSRPVIALDGVRKSYITSGSNPIVHSLLGEEYNEEMMGLKNDVPWGSMSSARLRNKKKSGIKKAEGESAFEEWTGFEASLQG